MGVGVAVGWWSGRLRLPAAARGNSERESNNFYLFFCSIATSDSACIAPFGSRSTPAVYPACLVTMVFGQTLGGGATVPFGGSGTTVSFGGATTIVPFGGGGTTVLFGGGGTTVLFGGCGITVQFGSTGATVAIGGGGPTVPFGGGSGKTVPFGGSTAGDLYLEFDWRQ